MSEDMRVVCPFCRTELMVSSELQGQQGECPNCQHSFLLAPSPVGDELAEPENEAVSQRGNYRFGRLFITVSRVLAVLAVLGGLFQAASHFTAVYKKSREFHNHMSVQIPDLIEQQQNFVEEFSRFTSVLLTKVHRSNETGFSFPADIATVPETFDYRLENLSQVEQSLRAVASYRERIELISSTMTEELLQTIEPFKAEEDESSTPATPVRINPRKRATGINLNLDSGFSLYVIAPDEVIQLLQRFAARELRDPEANKTKIASSMTKLSKYLNYIDNNLIGRGTSIRTGKGEISSSLPEELPVSGNNKPSQDSQLYAALASTLETLSSPYNNDTPLWRIAEKLDQLEQQLDERRQSFESFSSARAEAIKTGLLDGGLGLLFFIIIAFLVLVFADYLRAHFDLADNLRALLRKQSGFLALLLAAGFLTGCGPDPEALLERDQSRLCGEVIQRIFQEAAADNPGCFFFSRTPEELTIVAAGSSTVKEEQLGQELEPIPIFRSYECVTLSYKFVGSSITGFGESATPDFPYNATLIMQVERKIEKRMNAAGVTVHTFAPSNYAELSPKQQRRWLTSHLKTLPDPKYDLALVLAEDSEQETCGEVLTESLRWSSERKRWELREAPSDTPLQLHDLPSAEVQEQLEAALLNKGYEKIGDFWMLRPDAEIYRKIQQGLVLWENQWVPRQARELERQLEAATNKYKRDSTRDNLYQLIKCANIAPAGKRRDQAVTFCDAELLKIINQLLKNNREESLLQLAELMEKSDDFQCLRDQNSYKQCLAAARRFAEISRQQELIEAALGTETPSRQALQNLRKISGELEVPKNVLERIDELYFLCEIRDGVSSSLKQLRDNDYQAGKIYLGKSCSHCNGSGYNRCATCGGTGKCPKCHGTGYRTVGSALAGDHLREIPCRKECPTCFGKRTACLSCRGSGHELNEMKLAREIKFYIDSLCLDFGYKKSSFF